MTVSLQSTFREDSLNIRAAYGFIRRRYRDNRRSTARHGVGRSANADNRSRKNLALRFDDEDNPDSRKVSFTLLLPRIREVVNLNHGPDYLSK